MLRHTRAWGWGAYRSSTFAENNRRPVLQHAGGCEDKSNQNAALRYLGGPYLPYMERPDAIPEMAKESVERRSPVSTAIPKMV